MKNKQKRVPIRLNKTAVTNMDVVKGGGPISKALCPVLETWSNCLISKLVCPMI